jgi:hypothetical protein
MVAVAQRRQEGEVGWSEFEPVGDVVDLAPVERHRTARHDTGSMCGAQRAALGVGGKTPGAAGIERD